MSAGSGQGSDPHLLALLRAIRLRQNAPDAAAAGAADTAAALSEVAARARESQERAKGRASHDPTSQDRDSRGGDQGSSYGSGRSGGFQTSDFPAADDMSGDAELGAGLSPEHSFPGEPAPLHSQMPPPAPPRPARRAEDKPARPTSELLWRGDPGATLGRSGLGGQPGRKSAASRGVWGASAGRINPISGVNPAGPTTPATPVTGVESIRPRGPFGTEFPNDPSHYGGGGYPPRTPHDPAPIRNAPGADGMDPADDAALRDTQRLLSTSITFAGGTTEVAERLWGALRQAQPDLLAALPGTPDTQRAHLARALTWIAHNLDNPPAVVAGCGQLGAALSECGVQWSQLQLVGAALAEAMRAGMPTGTWRQDFDHAWRWAWQHTYEWIVHGGTLTAYQPTVWDARVISHELRRPDLAVIRVRPHLPMPYRPGQYARVEVGGLPGVWRPYSLAGAPHRDDTLELHVRATSAAGVSHTLVHTTRVGHWIRLTRAEGDMTLPAETGRGILMIAGDTGIAPMKALLAELSAAADARPAVLFWGVRDLTDLYDIEDVTAIAHEAPRATVVPVVTEGNPGPYAGGLVTDAVAAYGEWSRHEVYLAGPPLMIAATAAALEHLGIAPSRIHHDPAE